MGVLRRNPLRRNANALRVNHVGVGAAPDTVTIDKVTQSSTTNSIYTNGRCRIEATTTAADGTLFTFTVDGETAGTATSLGGALYLDFLVTAAMVPAAGSGNPATVEVTDGSISDTTTVNVTSEAVNVLGWYDPSESAYVSLDGSGNIDGLTDRSTAGNDLTWNAGSGASTGVPTATVSGLTVCDWSDAGDGRQLENAYASATKYISCVGRYDGALADKYQGMAGTAAATSDRLFFLGAVSGVDWVSGLGHTHYRDGTATTAVDNSLHFYESSHPSGSAGLVIGCDPSFDARTWNGPTGEVLALDAVPSSNYQEAELDYAQTKWGTP
jgi:hypothetical protein